MQIGSMPVMPQGVSPRDQVVNTLNAQVEAGDITSEDQDAMMAGTGCHPHRAYGGRASGAWRHPTQPGGDAGQF